MKDKGQKIPPFFLLGIDEGGNERRFTNEDFLGKLLLIYFYPKDNTPGCTKESCAFNVLLGSIKSNVNIVGVSADSIESHKKFQQKYGLSFPLLSDKDTVFAKQMGAVKDKIIQKIISKGVARSTFLIDKEGKLIKPWYNVKVDGHDKEVLEEIGKNLLV